ncbi:MAG: saccharopine dehydrogenase family protein, partial [Spirochaetia bacterium]|nr:saccharopine dehydrogenase family protein [Spirochaetia bacterium]
IEPILYEGIEVQPLQFLKAVLPEPSSLGENYKGETSIGVQLRGIKDGKERTVFIYNNCKHQMAYEDTKAQAVSYTTGVPASIGGRLLAQGIWKKSGVWNMEQFDPDPFMALLAEMGLPWEVVIDGELSFSEGDMSHA